MQIPDAVRSLERDLRDVFGERLRSLVVYRAMAGDDRISTLVVVDALSAGDLDACARRVAAWDDAGLDTPLFVATHEFGRSLDAFPFEFGAILAEHAVVYGADPFTGLRVDPAHLRHACEIQARSHLLHLREGFLETRGRGDGVAALLLRSAAPLVALVTGVVRLSGKEVPNGEAAATAVEREIGLTEGRLRDIAKLSGRVQLSADEARRLFPGYLDAVERLTTYIDRWSAA